jgi:hypothetical protein
MATIVKRLTKGTLLTKAEMDANFNNLNKELIQLTPAIFAPRAAYGNVLIEPPVSGVTVTPAANITINSSAATSVNGEMIWRVSATSSSASLNYFEISLPLASDPFSAKDLTVEIYTPDMSKLEQMIVYAGNTAYTQYVSKAIAGAAIVPNGANPFAVNGLTAFFVHEALWTKSGFSHPVGDLPCTQCKLRVHVPNGSTLVFGLRSIRACAMRKKARLAIVGDDGLRSWIRMAVPILHEYGFKSTMSIIYVLVGHPGYATLSELQAVVAAGNECVTHGPNHPVTSGSGNLFTAWATNDERRADVLACRDYLINNALTSEWGAKCYIWPQSIYTTSVTDLSFLEMMRDSGFTVARTASGTNGSFYLQKNNALCANNLQRLCGPIIGHTWTSAGTEAANIASIIAYIQGAVAAGGDVTLMLHKVVGPDAAAAATEISSNRLRELCVAIKSEVDASNLDVVLYSDFAR